MNLSYAYDNYIIISETNRAPREPIRKPKLIVINLCQITVKYYYLRLGEVVFIFGKYCK